MFRVSIIVLFLTSFCHAGVRATELVPTNNDVQVSFKKQNELINIEINIKISELSFKRNYWRTTLFIDKKHHNFDGVRKENGTIVVNFDLQKEQLHVAKVWVRFGDEINEQIYLIFLNSYFETIENNKPYKEHLKGPSQKNESGRRLKRRTSF